MALSDLVTCIVQRGRKHWDAVYASDVSTDGAMIRWIRPVASLTTR